MVTINDGSQGVLSFEDPYSGQIVATVTLTAGSQVTMHSATRPRFELSRRNYAITLDNAAGTLLVAATAGTRAFVMDIGAEAGTAHIVDSGQYTVSLDRDAATHVQHIHVFNQGGEVYLQRLQPLPTEQKVWPNTIGNASTGDATIQMTNSPYTLLISGLFKSTQPVAASDLPQGWQCSSGSSNTNEPPGQWARSADNPPEDHYPLRLWRLGSNLNHGETSCLTFPNNTTGWLDTSPYKTLRIQMRLKLKVDAALHIPDVPVCGVQASECPVMLELAWTTDPTNTNQSRDYWHHGFFSLSDPSYPLICDTCRVAHDHINPDVWYFYDSGDLRPQLPNVPFYITRLSVYASGHQYDALIGEVALLGGS